MLLDADERSKIYAVKCVACHGVDGVSGINDRLVVHSPDEAYALTAHLLYLNHIIPEDADMNAETLPKVEMPARDSFVLDDRQNNREVH